MMAKLTVKRKYMEIFYPPNYFHIHLANLRKYKEGGKTFHRNVGSNSLYIKFEPREL
jgi:hypothetical protein